MHRLPHAWALLLAVSAVGLAAVQSVPTGALSEELRTHVRAERFDIVTSVRGLPLGVRDELQRMWQSQALDIAEPGAEYQGSAAANWALPTRRLVAAGCSSDHHCLVYYQRAGRPQAWVVALFHWTPAMTRFDGGGAAPGELKTVEEVRKAVLAGALRPIDRW